MIFKCGMSPSDLQHQRAIAASPESTTARNCALSTYLAYFPDGHALQRRWRWVRTVTWLNPLSRGTFSPPFRRVWRGAQTVS